MLEWEGGPIRYEENICHFPLCRLYAWHLSLLSFLKERIDIMTLHINVIYAFRPLEGVSFS
jgi:hypothetical protein